MPDIFSTLSASGSTILAGLVIFFARHLITIVILAALAFLVSRFIPRGVVAELWHEGGLKLVIRRAAASLSAGALILFVRYVLGMSTPPGEGERGQAKRLMLYGRGFSSRMISRIERYRSFVLTLVFSPILALVTSTLVKYALATPRPFIAYPEITPLFHYGAYESFPSTHAAVAGAIAFALFIYYPKTGMWFGFFALVIGFARVFAGIHFPIDIVAGYAVGIVSALILHAVFDRHTQTI